ncbi:MAG: sodium:proton antiporter [Bacteroidales bacterium]|jgi:Na+/H+ antiporter NhaD/arsenite permease-like protein|nr:sodium:proton antiporter [Bacteroidales bacterium]
MHEAHELLIPTWALIPFVLMLLSIAIMPLVAEHWWEHNKNKLIVSLVLGIPTAIYLFVAGGHEGIHELQHALIGDYLPFIILLGSLFVVTGGIFIQSYSAPTPLTNTMFLAIGAILASFMGTTGAAMLLIRPVITTIQKRKFQVHTILFFIAVVANCGGLLTPLGDPPLFLLYLRGVEFSWFFNLLPQWAVANGLLLIIYFVWDSILYKKEHPNVTEAAILETEDKGVKLTGNLNFLFLAGIVISVAYLADYKFLQSVVMLCMAGLSIVCTKKEVRAKNKFSWVPIIEVAFLFLGIFITMIPALLYLKQASFNITEAWQFYYATGALSSFLDNAPTALSFFQLAEGVFNTQAVSGDVLPVLKDGYDHFPVLIMKAIAIGAVFFGSMTYIGNGPNFMIKAIAEENKITMPSFFGYMIRFSLIVLLPVYIVVQLLFI